MITTPYFNFYDDKKEGTLSSSLTKNMVNMKFGSTFESIYRVINTHETQCFSMVEAR